MIKATLTTVRKAEFRKYWVIPSLKSLSKLARVHSSGRPKKFPVISRVVLKELIMVTASGTNMSKIPAINMM